MDIIAESQDGGVSNLAMGYFTADGTDTVVTTGFLPRYIEVLNLTDRISHEWYRGMDATNTLKTVAAGTRTLDTTSAIVAKGASDEQRGFTIPAAVAIGTKKMFFRAHG